MEEKNDELGRLFPGLFIVVIRKRESMNWAPVSGLLAIFVVPACLSKVSQPVEDNSPQVMVSKLNKNVEGLRVLANACIASDSVAIFDLDYRENRNTLYWLSMKEKGDIELYGEIVSEDGVFPNLSMDLQDGVFYWMVNNAFVLDKDGNRISVTDLTKPISFSLRDESVYCKVNNTIVDEYPFAKSEEDPTKDVSIRFDSENSVLNLRLSSGFSTVFPTVSAFQLLNTPVQNRSYYKDIFMDAGIALTARKTLAAADYLGLSLEAISCSSNSVNSPDTAVQNAMISGDSSDQNGRLLYPDGQPRYRLLFVNGGTSTTHGQSLDSKGLENMRAFVERGGSYLGMCAGAFFAANGYDNKADYPYYLSIWPGMVQHTGLSKTRFGMFIEQDSPLLRYYDFGSDHYVDSVRHNSGGYPAGLPKGTEVLARYDFPKKSSVHKKPSVWAYKKSPQSGRVIMEGSHPEEVPDGERRDLTAAMMLYAMEGGGTASLKGYLKNGRERIMNKNSTDNDPAFTRIGDLQTHHFVAYIPSDARNIRVELNSSSKCDFALMMNQETYAFSDVAEYRSSIPGAKQQLSFPSVREGFWFIAVQCLTTVTVKETDYGQEYGGKTEVLNGVPYKIMISWE